MQIERRVWIRTDRKNCLYSRQESNGKHSEACVSRSEYQMNRIGLTGKYNEYCLLEYIKMVLMQ